MSIRPATEADLPMILELGRKFHEAAGERGEYCPETTAKFIRYLMEEGCVFVSERGMVGGFAWPSPWCKDHIIALEAFWWSEDRHGKALMEAYESWAKEQGAAQIRMGYLHAIRPKAVETVLRRRGYEPLETIMVK